jgi:hypothetical protein
MLNRYHAITILATVGMLACSPTGAASASTGIGGVPSDPCNDWVACPVGTVDDCPADAQVTGRCCYDDGVSRAVVTLCADGGVK